ncbi:MAG: tetratricopeptide repeat protein [Spirochaetaceae bacterium]|nr:tetratricopeptide repeat protein [Spirochaetaceae bacterium]
MKKLLCVFVCFCCFSTIMMGQQSFSLEMTDIIQNFSESNYAITVELTQKFLEKNPPAVYTENALQILAESYWHLKEYEKSLNFYSRLENNKKNDYYKAMALYYLQRPTEFYSTATSALGILAEDAQWVLYLNLSHALINSYIHEKKFEDAMLFCREYFRKYKNLTLEQQEKNNETLKTIILVYAEILTKTDNYANLVAFYEKNKTYFSQDYFLCDDYAFLLFSVASAYKKTAQPTSAVEVFTKVIESQSEEFSLRALEEAYEITDSKEKLLLIAEEALNTQQKVLAKFFLQTALDAFKQKNWVVANKFLDKTLEKNEKEFSESAFLCKEQLRLLENDFSSTASVIDSLENALASLEFYTEDYYYVLSQLYLIENDDEKFAQTLEKITKESYLPFVYYGKGLLAYKQGMFENAISFLSNDYCKNFVEAEVLLAMAFSHVGKHEDATLLFEKNIEKSITKLNFSKHLLLQKNYEKAKNFFADIHSRNSETLYLKAVTALALGNWEESKQNFKSYFALNDFSKEAGYHTYAKFYYAYALYRLTEYEEAFACFKEFSEKISNVSLVWKSYDYMTKSALQLYSLSGAQNWQQKGLFWAQHTFEKSLTEEQKIASLTQFVGMSIDAKNFDVALSVLEKPSQETSFLGMIALFQKAEVFLKQKNLEAVDDSLALIVQRFAQEQLAEDASYKRGEIFYHSKQWDKALERFSNYRSRYGNGKYYDSALYFSGQCLVELHQQTRGIMMFKDLVQHSGDSPHVFSALCKLVTLYQENEEYDQAIKTAEKLLAQFGDQAKRVGIEYQIEEILLLQKGESKEIARNFRLYRQHGELASAKGRSYGLLLAKAQMESASGKKDAEELLIKLIGVLQNAYKGEESVIAEASFLYGKILRDDLLYTEASDVFLKSAQLYSKIDTEKAAESMYRAVESLHTMGNPYDAQAVLNVMTATYKKSAWTEQAQLLLQRRGN